MKRGRTGLEGYTYVRTEYVGGEIHFRVRPKDPGRRGAGCGSREIIRKGRRQRWCEGPPFGRRPIWIVLKAARLGCRKCGAVKQAKLAFAPGRHRCTRRFARQVLDLTRTATMSDVARHLGVGWNVVKGICGFSIGVFSMGCPLLSLNSVRPGREFLGIQGS